MLSKMTDGSVNYLPRSYLHLKGMKQMMVQRSKDNDYTQQARQS
jgi:hypothetical protein